MMYDVAIVGGGPAGVTAAVYCARAGKSVVIFEKNTIGGKIIESPKVENIPGFSEISGMDYAGHLYEQIEHNNVEVIYDTVQHIEKVDNIFNISADECVSAKSVILATGTTNRLLGLEHEDEHIGDGISFCALCDGPFYRDKDVVVIGGGNSAVVEALELAEICHSVTIIQNLPELTAEKEMLDRLKKLNNINIVYNATVCKYSIADGKLTGIEFNIDDVIHTVECDGVFLAIGLVPQNKIFENLVTLNSAGFITISPYDSTAGCVPGIFACGDCTNSRAKQVAAACGSAVLAAMDAVKYLNS